LQQITKQIANAMVKWGIVNRQTSIVNGELKK